jgi:hypothetical protein
MILLDELVDPASKTDRSIRAGWDMCVLSLGVMGGIIAERQSSDADAVSTGIIALALILVCGIIIGLIRRSSSKRPQLGHAIWSLALGGAAASLPILWYTQYRGV